MDIDPMSDFVPVNNTFNYKKYLNLSKMNENSFPAPINLSLHKYHCIVCGESFHNEAAYLSHQLTHTIKAEEDSPTHVSDFDYSSEGLPKTEPVQCSECGDFFSSLFQLHVHYKTHVRERPFACLQCGKSFSWKSNLKRHVKIHMKEDFDFTRCVNGDTWEDLETEVRPFPCSVCGKNYTCITSLKKHQKLHSSQGAYACPECGKQFSSSSKVKSHLKTHSGEKPFQCMKCGKRFGWNSNLKRHQRVHIGGKGCKPFNVPSSSNMDTQTLNECAELFTKNVYYVSNDEIHTVVKLFPCLECGNYFNSCIELKKHQRVHKKQKTFICSECGVMFTCKFKFRSHLKVHTKEKPFRCLTCGRCFGWKSNLTRHLKVHVNEKPLVCQECGKKFLSSSNLMRHEKIHIGQWAVACPQNKSSLTNSKISSIAAKMVQTRYRELAQTGPDGCFMSVSEKQHYTPPLAKPYGCIKCGRRFCQYFNLFLHRKNHKKANHFTCSECGERFLTKRHLLQHERIHSGEYFVIL
ncbi:oocyte zinc finger protein XlCOF6-like [Dendropsophus ebraccatus]|uniref:oocyte zinc finger protein XlCOF6-like n=1 Tax=Dendropsophus ebraccatus TaxID=150705 RepID=UPI0038313DF0